MYDTRPSGARQDPYTQIHDRLHDLADSPREFQLMALLLSYRWFPTSPIIPSVETLAGRLKCSPRTVRRTVANLEDRGLLQREERRALDTRQMSNEYVLCGELLALVTALEVGRDQGQDQLWQGRRSAAAGKKQTPRNYPNRNTRKEQVRQAMADPASYLQSRRGPLVPR